MKKILLAIGLTALVTSSQAQGLVNFLNSSATLITLSSNSVSLGSTPASALGTFRYELFVAPAGTTLPSSFTSTGIIGTNLASAGRFNGGNNLVAAGAPLGGTAAILVRGWSAALGSTWAAANQNRGIIGGFFGESAIAANFLFGGDPGTGNVPSSPVFGAAAYQITSGFNLDYVPVVPEPSSMALAGLGAAALMAFRRKK